MLDRGSYSEEGKEEEVKGIRSGRSKRLSFLVLHQPMSLRNGNSKTKSWLLSNMRK